MPVVLPEVVDRACQQHRICDPVTRLEHAPCVGLEAVEAWVGLQLVEGPFVLLARPRERTLPIDFLQPKIGISGHGFPDPGPSTAQTAHPSP